MKFNLIVYKAWPQKINLRSFDNKLFPAKIQLTKKNETENLYENTVGLETDLNDP